MNIRFNSDLQVPTIYAPGYYNSQYYTLLQRMGKREREDETEKKRVNLTQKNTHRAIIKIIENFRLWNDTETQINHLVQRTWAFSEWANMIEQRKQTKQPTKLWKINLINIPRGENWQNYLFGGKKEVYTQIAILLLLLTMLRDMYIYRILFASVLFASLLIRFILLLLFFRSLFLFWFLFSKRFALLRFLFSLPSNFNVFIFGCVPFFYLNHL